MTSSSHRPQWVAEALICPDCRSAIDLSKGIQCAACGFSDPSGRDLRARTAKTTAVSLPAVPGVDIERFLAGIELRPPDIGYDGPPAERDSSAFMSEMATRLRPGARILDLGCGPRDQAAPVEYLGFDYLGVDYTSDAADFLIDAHVLPFADEAFDCVLSYAVFEHLHAPHIAIQEVARVLKPGGMFIGAMSQGEPFHHSYFHFTPWGLASLLDAAPSLKAHRLWPSMDTVQSLSRMGRYPRAIRVLLSFVDQLHLRLPILAPRKRRWPEREKALDALYRGGSICFCIVKQQG